MDVQLALLADYANISREGKLNILGIFDALYGKNFPIIHPQLQLVINFEATRAEEGKEKVVEVQFSDGDDNKLSGISGKLKIPKGQPGMPIKISHTLVINNLRIEKPGMYAFNILINGDCRRTVGLRVVQVEEGLKKK